MRRVVISMLSAFALLASNAVAAENIAQGVKVVVIDAGHGGSKYPGASYRGVTEKSLNLKVALKLGELIENRMPEIKVVYTRKNDMQFSADLNKDLQARAEIANKAGGDLFISIHANAARSTSARGVETLIMGESPLEQRVNENVLFANNKEEFLDMSNEKTAAVVRAYIQNLQFTYGEYSEMMARLIQKNYAKSGRVARGIKRQPLKVLYATDMPSVLTEIGFMSNPEELKYISSEKGQAEIAEDLYRAVNEYVEFVRKSLLVEEPAKAEPVQKSLSQQATAKVEEQKKPVKVEEKKAEEKPVAKSEMTANVPVRKPAEAVTAVKRVDVESVKPQTTTTPAAVVRVESGATKQPKAEPTKSTTEQAKTSGRAFVVQIMASATPLSVDDARFGKQQGKVCQYTAEGAYKYKYCVGRYTDRESAQRAAVELRSEFNGAFVVEVEGDTLVKR